jgi:HNH endonuclease
LIRDGYQCKIGGVYEQKVDEIDPVLFQELWEKDVQFRGTEAAHIIPLCFNAITDATMVGRGRAWRLLDKFAGGSGIAEFLRAENINNLNNILTLHRDIHPEFDDLRWWLEPYKVRRWPTFNR